jgi:hypothetical protein
VRGALVTALVAHAENSAKSPVRRFLRGLSCDELQFIASFLGACILESVEGPRAVGCIPGEAPTDRLKPLPANRGLDDRDLKMILLMEYLCRSGIRQTAIPVRSEARLGWLRPTKGADQGGASVY